MTNKNISDINVSFFSVDSAEARVNYIAEELRNDYRKFTEENAYYRQTSGGKIFLAIVLDILLAVLAAGCLYMSSTFFYVPAVSQNGAGIVSAFVFCVLVILFIYCVYRTVIVFYCKNKVEGYSRRIDRVENSLKEKITEAKLNNLLQKIISSAADNEEYTAHSNNNIGVEIAGIREGFTKTNSRAQTVKRAVCFGAAGALIVFLVLFMLIKVRPGIGHGFLSGVSLMLVCLGAAAFINLTQLKAGEFFGKYPKLIGAASALVYGLFLFITMKDAYGMPVFETDMKGFVETINVAYIIIPLIQVVGIVLTVFLSNYGLEREKLAKGFSVEMSYGSKNNGNKANLLFRGTVSTLFALAIFTLCAGQPIEDITSSLLIGALWYFSNNLMKPRGSYLYAFWGRGRCVANEILMISVVFTAIIGSRGTVTAKELVFFGLAFGFSFVVAAITKIINNFV